MTNTYDTSNEPLGSTAVKVLYNNASNLDEAVNSDADTWVDRPPFGRIRRTWRGMENAFDQFLLNSGYQFIGDYDADGPLTITAANQIFSKDGEYWRPGPGLALPYTTVNNWAVDQPKFVSVGDAALRSDLIAPLTTSTGASLVAGAHRTVANVGALFGLPGRNQGDLIATGSYLSNSSVGGTTYYWNSTRQKSQHDGVTVISPTVPNGGVVAHLTDFYTGVGETDPSGSGCWDLLSAEIDAFFAGCQPGNIDNAIPLAHFLNLCGTIPRKGKLSDFITTAQAVDLSYPKLVLHGIGWRLSGFKVTVSGVAAFATGIRPNIGTFSLGQQLADFTVEGNINTTVLFQHRMNHSTVRNVNVREASPTGVAWSIEGSVLTTFENISCSTNLQPMTNKPLYGIILKTDPDDPEGPRRASANTFIRPLMEGLLGDGIVVQASDQNTFIGGTSEGNAGIGVSITSGCRANSFKGVGLENTGGDVFDDGQMNAFENCYGTRELIVGANSQFHHTYGGYFNSVTVHVSASFPTIENIQYNWLPGSPGTFNDNNNLTLSTRNLRNVTSGFYYFPKKTPVVVTVGASPFTYFNNSGKAEHVYVSAGTITFQREGVDYYQIAPTTMIPLLPGDGVEVEWSGSAPFMARIPFGSVLI